MLRVKYSTVTSAYEFVHSIVHLLDGEARITACGQNGVRRVDHDERARGVAFHGVL